MASYEIEKQINSCFVDKSLLEDLETYVLNTVEEGREKGGKGSIDLSENLSVCLLDNYGTEQLNSIKNYQRDKFSNDIRVICMCYKDIYNEYRTIKISFGIIDAVSKIKIKHAGNNPKEKAQGVLQVMENYINQNKNINLFFMEHYNG
ncbi:hypothetical protein MUO66_02115 [Candidatus Bathyarchaeota archaeon]|nr:hypothetical protein [Candidatus Bathyarchaeota archaeon]